MIDAYVVMNRASGQGPDSQWLDFTTGTGFFTPAIRVEWDLDTMHIIVPQATADMLIRNGHARLMTSQERDEYVLSPKQETTTKGETP